MTEQFPDTPLPTRTGQRFHTVCKRVFHADSTYFPLAKYHGEIVYFCTEACLNAFLADPERFYCGHSAPASRK